MTILRDGGTWLCMLLCALRTCADLGPFFKDAAFDAGDFGEFPSEEFVSSDNLAPRLNMALSSPECSSLSTIMGLRGGATPYNSATVLDAAGTLIYQKRGDEEVYNVMVQDYLGEPFLTCWMGTDKVKGHGEGSYYMFDAEYQLRYKLDAANGLLGDLHDFCVLENGNALITIYQPFLVDFAVFQQGRQGFIYDCLFQEIVVATGELVFEWRASDHLSLADSERSVRDEGTEDYPYDWFHINSVDKDDKGNYLVSSRLFSSLFYISGQTGEVLWILGGHMNMFEDLSDGRATGARFQHDARWHDNFTTITLFDNGGWDEWFEHDSRGVKIRVDQERRTAEVITEYFHPDKVRSLSQGSLQVLPSGNVLLGYGKIGLWTEFSSTGTVLCDVHMGPKRFFGSGAVESYRTYKAEWHGKPPWPPDLQVMSDDVETTLFVSWNGATEVATWALQGSEVENALEQDWQDLDHIRKHGFETAFAINDNHPRYLRATAKNIKGESIGSTAIADRTEEKIIGLRPMGPSGDRSRAVVLIAASLVLFGVLVAWRECKASHPWHRQHLEIPLQDLSNTRRGATTLVSMSIRRLLAVLKGPSMFFLGWRSWARRFRRP